MKISHKVISKTVVVNTALNEAWNTWTTHDGLKRFFGRDNKINLKIGGEFEIYFLMNNEYGQKGSEGCKILSYIPNKMLSFSWNVPPKFEMLRKSQYKTWVVIVFNEIENDKTEIILYNYGYPIDDEWNLVFDYFNEAWEEVLSSFKNL